MMNYKMHYNLLIGSRRELNRSKKNGIFENHHTIPKCMGGSNDKDNLILLTPREHLFAHLLLCEIYPEEGGLGVAVYLMWNNSKRRISCRIYQEIKENFILGQKGIKNGMHGKTNYNIWLEKYGKEEADRRLKESNRKISISNSGKNGPMWKKSFYDSWLEKYGKKEADRRLEEFGNKKSGKNHPYYEMTGKNHPRSKGVIQYDMNGNFINEYGSIRDAAKALKISHGGIVLVCGGKRKTSGGYKWSHKKINEKALGFSKNVESVED